MMDRWLTLSIAITLVILLHNYLIVAHVLAALLAKDTNLAHDLMRVTCFCSVSVSVSSSSIATFCWKQTECSRSNICDGDQVKFGV